MLPYLSLDTSQTTLSGKKKKPGRINILPGFDLVPASLKEALSANCYLAKAIATIDGLITTWLKRDLCILAALRTCYGKHLA